MKPLMDKFVAIELVGTRPASADPIAIARAKRERNVDSSSVSTSVSPCMAHAAVPVRTMAKKNGIYVGR